jgi:type I restriction-modification system DNA methylase subunit
LYVPYDLPSQDLEYNFSWTLKSWIDADVLGLAYEKYLASVLAPLSQSDSVQLALFDQPVREVKRKTVRKSSGVYYTPIQLVSFLVESCFDNLVDEVSPTNIPRIADFACGSGSFLVSAANSLIVRLRKHNPKKNWAREEWH